MFRWRLSPLPATALAASAVHAAESDPASPVLLTLALLLGPLALALAFYLLHRTRTLERALVDVKRTSDDEQRIAAATFEVQEGMIVTDAQGRILRVNRAFSELTGYTPGEVIGATPALLKSGMHGEEFYRNLWITLEREGYWRGEIWNRRKSGEVYPEWLAITAVRNDAGQATHYVGAFFDISQRKEAEDQIRSLAFYDPLTGLPNRRLFLDRVGHALASRHRDFGAVMFLDLDHFKTLNDTRGHDMGDRLLVEVAQRLTGALRPGDTVARMGGDEFVIMIEELGEDEHSATHYAQEVAEKARECLSQPYTLNDQTTGRSAPHHCTVSIGVSLFRADGTRTEEVIKRADLAMYQAKASGRNAIRLFDPRQQREIESRSSLQEELREALARRELCLYFQVQVDNDLRVIGAEALLRWQHPRRGLILPDDFIPMAEESGLIVPIGRWVLEEACAQLKRWERGATASLQLAVNVSPLQFRQPDFVAHVRDALEKSGANPRLLKLELTETMVLHNLEDAVVKMRELRDMGIAFSMDDFGTGYSSLSSLHRLPLDQLKIDRSFIHDLANNRSNAVIVETIISMGRTLGLNVIAEGLENESQRVILNRTGCHAFQGYLFGRPVSLEEFERLVTHGR